MFSLPLKTMERLPLFPGSSKATRTGTHAWLSGSMPSTKVGPSSEARTSSLNSAGHLLLRLTIPKVVCLSFAKSLRGITRISFHVT